MSQNRPEHSSWAQKIQKPGERPVWLWWLLQRMEEKGNGFLFPISPHSLPFLPSSLGWGRGKRTGAAILGQPGYEVRQKSQAALFHQHLKASGFLTLTIREWLMLLPISGWPSWTWKALLGLPQSRGQGWEKHRHFCARAEEFLLETLRQNEPQWVLQGEEIEIDLLRK